MPSPRAGRPDLDDVAFDTDGALGENRSRSMPRSRHTRSRGRRDAHARRPCSRPSASSIGPLLVALPQVVHSACCSVRLGCVRCGALARAESGRRVCGGARRGASSMGPTARRRARRWSPAPGFVALARRAGVVRGERDRARGRRGVAARRLARARSATGGWLVVVGVDTRRARGRSRSRACAGSRTSARSSRWRVVLRVDAVRDAARLRSSRSRGRLRVSGRRRDRRGIAARWPAAMRPRVLDRSRALPRRLPSSRPSPGSRSCCPRSARSTRACSYAPAAALAAMIAGTRRLALARRARGAIGAALAVRCGRGRDRARRSSHRARGRTRRSSCGATARSPGSRSITLFDLDGIRDEVPLSDVSARSRGPGADHPDIILITIDTVRADHTPPYGGRPRCPRSPRSRSAAPCSTGRSRRAT